MYYDDSISRERNDRINKIIRLIQKAEVKNEIINKTTLQKEGIGSSATLGRELSKIGAEGEKIITFDKHKLTFRMNKNWKSAKHIKSDSLLDYGSLGIMKSVLEQYQNTPLYKSVIDKIEELAEMPIEDFSRIAVPPKPEYNKEDQKKFSKIFDYMTQNFKIQFYYTGRWHGDERKNRVVRPYQLLLDNGTCYLYGYDEEKQDDRLFVLRRMEEIRLKNSESFELPVDFEFSLKHGFSKFGAYTFKELIKYKIEFYGNTQIWISENKWAEDQILEVSENKTTLTFTSSQDDKILEWILSCGPDAKPVEPNEFVQRWKDKICEMAELAGI